MSSDQLRRVLIPRRRYGYNPKMTLTDIMVEAPTKVIKPLVVDVSHAIFHRERTHGFDQTEAGNVMVRAWLLDEPSHRLGPVFRVIIFDERTRIKEVIGHLEALSTLCNHHVSHGPGNFGQRLPHVL